MVGVTTTWGTVLKGRSIRKVGSRWCRREVRIEIQAETQTEASSSRKPGAVRAGIGSMTRLPSGQARVGQLFCQIQRKLHSPKAAQISRIRFPWTVTGFLLVR